MCFLLTLEVPNIEENAYGGKLPCDPIANACEIRNSGDMPKTLVKSARSPVNIKFERRTSFCTSRATLSTVPGFDSPRARLRCVNELYASFNAAMTALSAKNARGEALSTILEPPQEAF